MKTLKTLVIGAAFAIAGSAAYAECMGHDKTATYSEKPTQTAQSSVPSGDGQTAQQ